MAETMLVTQALNELKTLDGRINRKIKESTFVSGAKSSDKNVTPGYSKEDFNVDAKSNEQSIVDLIKRRERIKSAVVHSNAITVIEKLHMTVAQAIDTKTSIAYKKTLLSYMVNQYNNAVATVNKHNSDVDYQINAMLNSMYNSGKDKDKKTYSEEDYNAIATPYKANNGWELVDPLNIKDEIDSLRKEIEDFESCVDSELQISNCTTTITIE